MDNRGLVKYEAARAALAECRRVDEVKEIHDRAEALRAYARQKDDHEMETWAAEIKVRAKRRIGEISDKLGKGHGTGENGSVKLPPSGSLKSDTLRAAGITTQTASRCERIADVPEEDFEAVIEESRKKKQPVSSKDLIKKSTRRAKDKKHQKVRASAAASLTMAGAVRVGDFRVVLSDVPDGSVDLIFTDPPYSRESLPLYDGLAELANRVLVNGGSLITYFGQSLLPEVLQRFLFAGLTYRWLICVRHEKDHARVAMPKVAIAQKPLLWFSRGVPFQTDFVADLIESKQPDKVAHDWQQSGVEASYLIERLSPSGGMVLDPMAGSGTTLRIAKHLGRQFLGAEIDPERAKVASASLQ
jgi:hypothetical protein